MICGPCEFGRHQDCTGLLRAQLGFCACADREHQSGRTAEQQRIAAMNEVIFLTAVRNWFKRQEEAR